MKWVNRYTVSGSVLLAGYLAFSSPGEVAVSVDGEVRGLINKARATIQQRDFWKDQMSLVEAEYDELRDEPARKARMERELNSLLAEADRVIAQTDREVGIESGAAQRSADQYRDRAAAIEDAEMRQWLNQIRLERMRELRTIAVHVQSHL
ncbi:hypothetical protein [Halomonas koreensis]|uniref:Uncharacterized protein n=1 Tax=Halomonas koreensis TaxID=245385 RepID=A0ABU1G4R7_9GAMM|nr:hypothetical protein [Halomonas koreensis]MDR5867958.1 hypothetical protein [Halomonas koreensis]